MSLTFATRLHGVNIVLVTFHLDSVATVLSAACSPKRAPCPASDVSSVEFPLNLRDMTVGFLVDVEDTGVHMCRYVH